MTEQSPQRVFEYVDADDARTTYHNTPAQTERYIETAVLIADRLRLSPDDRAVLLPKIVDLLGAKSATMELPASARILGGHAGLDGLRG
jgi:hypothetical protein